MVLAKQVHEKSWKEQYGDKHRPRRILEFPIGVEPPQKVRIYARNDAYLLQFWDPGEKRTLSERVEGDFISAIFRARELDERLIALKRSGKVAKYRHHDLAKRFLADLNVRCEAGEIDPTTVERYGSAIEFHYKAFCDSIKGQKYRSIHEVDRQFQLEFSTFLKRTPISPNGHKKARQKLMESSGQDYVLNVVRSMYCWAADPGRGKMLPSGFVNPFTGRKRKTNTVTPDRVNGLPITVAMVVDLLSVCDEFQLPLFGCLSLYGLRPSEPGWVFHEDLDQNWFRVQCKPSIDYFTKGRQDKKFPMLEALKPFQSILERNGQGLRFQNRNAKKNNLHPISLKAVNEQFAAATMRIQNPLPTERRKLRDKTMRQQGHLNYDQVRREFDKLRQKLDWPNTVRPMALRHLFSTCVENAGVPTFFRKYMMGQSFGREAIVSYTHITEDKLREHYNRALHTELAPIHEALKKRRHKIEIELLKQASY